MSVVYVLTCLLPEKFKKNLNPIAAIFFKKITAICMHFFNEKNSFAYYSVNS